MKLDVNLTYQLHHNVRLSHGLYNGTIISEGTLVKVLYWDDVIAECEAINGCCDGIRFTTSPSALSSN